MHAQKRVVGGGRQGSEGEKTKSTIPKEIWPTKGCYKAVAEPLGKDVTIKEIMETLPKEVFEKSYVKAIRTIII